MSKQRNHVRKILDWEALEMAPNTHGAFSFLKSAAEIVSIRRNDIPPQTSGLREESDSSNGAADFPAAYEAMKSLCGMADKSCKRNTALLIQKLALEETEKESVNTRVGRTYRVYSFASTLARRKAAGMEWATWDKGRRFVQRDGSPLVPNELLGDKTSTVVAEATVVVEPPVTMDKTSTVPMDKASTGTGDIMSTVLIGTSLGIKKGIKTSSSSDLQDVVQALSEYASVADEQAAFQLIRSCREVCPDASVAEAVGLTGVARAHPLLEGSLKESDCLTLSSQWGTDDSNGHGTKMSGSVLFSDLTAPLSGTDEVLIPFILESVKLVPPAGFPANEPESYGSLTQAAVAIAEINAPHRDRTFCMAITSQDVSGETPTSWSAALDQICAGALIGDDVAEPHRRLFFVSAGNIQDNVLPEQMEELGEFPVEDPAQSWNAVSVGGYTNKSEIHLDETDYTEWRAFALAGALSPFSRISTDWEHSRTPVKPEIVFEAGNRALSPNEMELLTGLSSLSLLTTSKDFLTEPLESFWATSPATAQAAGMAGRLMAHDPSWWPETIRALMIHNASWTPWMIARLEEATVKADKVQLARHFGYGVPSLERSLASAENDLCMISQTEIQPYFREPNYVNGKVQFSTPKLHHMHVYDLPWPVSALQDLREQEVQLRVTLSYFVEPNLGDLTSVLPGKYRSCGLRFEMKRDSETEEGFLKRVNSLARDAASTLLPAPPDPDWLFGNRSISAGSIHSDIWSGPGATLALRNKIVIIPVGGWWKDRVKAKKYDASMRYTLILSITSKDNEALLYSEVQQLIGIPIDVDSA